MNEKKYITTSEKYELVLIAAAAYNVGKYAADTKAHAQSKTEKKWAKHLQMAATLMNKSVLERIEQLDAGQKKDMSVRMSGCLLKVVPFDQAKIQKKMRSRELHTCFERDLMMVCELALIGCHNCPQGEYVNKCEYREALHACGVPISKREAEGPGRCEFRSEDGIQILLPQGHDKHAELLEKKLSAIFTIDGKKQIDGNILGEFF